jgi:hypothetical protein
MAERVQSVAPGSAPVELRRLPHLLEGARVSEGEDKRALATEINQALFAMRAAGQEEAEAKVLVAALDAHRFDGLVDSQGRSCRKEAVDTLLASGFPHALSVNHEDLVFAREWVPSVDDGPKSARRATAKKAGVAGALLTLVGQLVGALMILVGGRVGAGGGASMVLGAVSTLIAAQLARGAGRDDQAWWGSALGIAALLQLVVALEVGAPALIGAVAGLVGLAICFGSQYERRADPPKPGDWDYQPDGWD